MSDLLDRVKSERDFFSKILSKIPGFSGYIDRNNRRASDKLLREVVADRFEEQWQRISGLQRELISSGGLSYIDDLESAAIKLRQFIDRVRTASYGYAPFFAAIKINSTELEQIYQYDLTLLEMVDETKNAVDHVEASIGTDGLMAAIRNLTTVSSKCVETFNRRGEVIQGTQSSK